MDGKEVGSSSHVKTAAAALSDVLKAGGGFTFTVIGWMKRLSLLADRLREASIEKR